MFTTRLRIEALDTPGEWRLTGDLRWVDEEREIEVPQAFITDLASVPGLFRSFIDINGPLRRPAVLHDWLYCARNKHAMTRAQADKLFLIAMRSEGTSRIVARACYAAVRAGGWRYWKKRNGGLTQDDFSLQVFGGDRHG